MKWLARILVFGMAFAIGLAAAGGRAIGSGLSNCVVHLNNGSVPASKSLAMRPTGGIEVAYAGSQRNTSDGEPYLRFIVHNGLDREVRYISHLPEYLMPVILIDHKPLPGIVGCGTGRGTHYIPAGSSAELRVSTYHFTKRPKRTDQIIVAFDIAPKDYDNDELPMSPPFTLPEEFRRAIRP